MQIASSSFHSIINITCINVDAYLQIASSSNFQHLLSLLQPEEQVRVKKFRHKIDKYRSLTGRILLRSMANCALNVPWNDLQFKRTEENKPYLFYPKRNGFNLNVSHHGKWVAGACDDRVLVGIDVMRYERPRGCKSIPDFFNTMRQYFTLYEWNDIEHTTATTTAATTNVATTTSTTNNNNSTSNDKTTSQETTETTNTLELSQLRQFYKHWALKESYIKAVGIGLGFELSRAEFRFLNEDRDAMLAVMYIDGILQKEWTFTLYEPDVEHCVVVALGPLKEATPHFLDVLTPLPEQDGEIEAIATTLSLTFDIKCVDELVDRDGK